MTEPLDHDAERKRIIRGRNRVMAGLLVAMCVLFYLITLARTGS